MEIAINPNSITNVYLGSGAVTSSNTCVRIRNKDGVILWSRKDTISCTFKLRDSKDESTVLEPDTLKLDSNAVEYSYSDGLITLTVPKYSEFKLEITKDGYNPLNQSFTYQSLNGVTQTLTKIQAVTESEGKTTWTHTVVKDLDSHLLIYDSEGNKLGKVFYSKKSYSDSNTTVTLDVDDRGQSSSDNGETVTVNPFCADYTYVFVLHDYTNKGTPTSKSISESEATVTMTYDNVQHVIKAPYDTTGIYWGVYKIEKGVFTEINTLSQTNDWNI